MKTLGGVVGGKVRVWKSSEHKTRLGNGKGRIDSQDCIERRVSRRSIIKYIRARVFREY